MRAGSPDIILGYTKDAFAEKTRIADEPGRSIEPGFFLVKFSGDCLCHFATDPCRDAEGKACNVKAELMVIPMNSQVDLTIVDDPMTFAALYTPDWLFLSPTPDPGEDVTEALFRRMPAATALPTG